MSASSEFYQPLDYSDRFFIAPRLEYERSIADIYSGNTRVAEYSVRSTSASAQAGVNFGTFAVAKGGILRGKINAGPHVGGEGLPDFDIDQGAWIGSFQFDQLDNANFPLYGISGEVDLFAANEGLGGDEAYEKLAASLMKATTFDKRHTFLASIDAGTSVDEDLPFYDEYALGGFLFLSGYRRGELRGQHMGLARLVYYFKVSKVSLGFGDDVYVGCSLESGNVWADRDDIAFDELRYAGSGFVGIDTIFGPLYLGYGIAEESHTDGVVYLFLGQTF